MYVFEHLPDFLFSQYLYLFFPLVHAACLQLTSTSSPSPTLTHLKLGPTWPPPSHTYPTTTCYPGENNSPSLHLLVSQGIFFFFVLQPFINILHINLLKNFDILHKDLTTIPLPGIYLPTTHLAFLHDK